MKMSKDSGARYYQIKKEKIKKKPSEIYSRTEKTTQE